MEKYQIEGKIAELQECVVMCDENLDNTEKGSFTEAVLKDCKSAYIKHITDLEAILNLLPIQNVVGSASKRKPWNWGKRKPVEDDCGNKWCNCVEPNLVSNGGGRGQAYCLLCGEFWYH